MKYKIWDNKYNEFVSEYDYYILQQDGLIYLCEADYGGVVLYHVREQLMPIFYTGLKDLNDKEIFEGDIVNLHIFTKELGNNLGVREGEKEYRCLVEITPSGVEFHLIKPKECTGFILYSDYMRYNDSEEQIEVIGNKYENPELLEKLK